MPGKARDGKVTRATILSAARTLFSTHGFERTTIRSIAAEAGVDPALVMHYFGNKADLFAAVSRLEITFPDLTGVAPDRIADVLVPFLIRVWDPAGSFLPLLRAAATNRTAAEALLEVFVEKVAPALATVTPDRTAERTAMVGSQVLGIAMARNVVGVPALAEMDDATLTEWLRPVLTHYLTGAAP
ncbi:TetR family transcriptional regulator [Mycobacterium vulneris]|uniref:TetR family transcriptional regulator n=1 Tax=Mycolicibacterium vulneris TaxID=547163 RepID=A0A1X2LD70_9MYCO|nr:TetR/AcrR family transcriptional regulator [Mycolicibacterium vulneris]OSC31932.1 TetR family transcriptional regulator [Mycolicibacterium vulneris]